MATKTRTGEDQEAASNGLKCQTWVLKVSIACQGCKRKVKKVLQSIEGVYITIIDSQQQRVTVTGNIAAETLIAKLIKNGKHAELITHGTSAANRLKDQPTLAAMNNNVVVPTQQKGSNNNNRNENSTKLNVDKLFQDAINHNKSQETPNLAEDKKSKEVKSYKKEKKGAVKVGDQEASLASTTTVFYQTQGVWIDRSVDPTNQNRIRQHQVQSSESHGGPFDYFWPTPYVHANTTTSASASASTIGNSTNEAMTVGEGGPLDSLHIFSDENVNGCSIM